MSKLQGNTKLSRRLEKKKAQKNVSEKPQAKLTTVKSSRNVTTGLSPKTFRCTELDKAGLQELTEELQELTNKRLTESKVLRGLIAMRENLDKESLLKAIQENT